MKKLTGEILYKYRGGDQGIFERDLAALANDSFWAAEIPMLNDPCEALINSEGYFEELDSFEKVVHATVTTTIDFGTIRSKMNDLLTKARTCGVFSLSRTYHDELMWSHYAAAHHGFCIGYNMHYLKLSLVAYFQNVLEVVYSDAPPEIKMMEQVMSRDPKMGMEQLLATKSKNWENEEETRIVTDKPGMHTYDFRAVESIYFGLRMPDAQKDQLMLALQGRDIKYFQMQMAPNEYRFFAVPLADKFASGLKYKYQLAPVFSGADDEGGIQQDFKQHSGYLKKAVAIARREPYCLEVITSGFSFTCPVDQPVIFVHCKQSDKDYANFEYSLPQIDELYASISDL